MVKLSLVGASWIALGVAIAAGGVARAQDSGLSQTGNSATVSSVTVTAKGGVVSAPSAPPLASTFTESTITSDQIRNLSGGASVNIQTMLNNQPSIFAYSNGPLGVGTTINLRAFNSGQFAETYAGVALNDVFNGGVTGEADTVNNVLLIPENVDSVQIFRGINNPDVNSYNSLGGTINFIPRQPTADANGLVGGGYGSFDTREEHALFNTGDFYGLRQLVSINYGASDGWQPYTPSRNLNLFYNAAYTAPNDDHLGLTVIYNHNNAHTPLTMPTPLLQANGGFYQYPTSEAYEKDSNDHFLAILDFEAKVNDFITFDSKIFGGFNEYTRTSYVNPADVESATQPYYMFNAPTTSKTPYWLDYGDNLYNPTSVFGSSAKGTDYHYYGYDNWAAGWTPTVVVKLPFNTLTFGANVTYGDLHSSEYFYGSYNMPMTNGYNDVWDENDQRTLASAYVQDDIKLLNERLTISPGVKFIYAHTRDADGVGFYYPYGGTVSDDEHFVAPTVGLNYKLTDQLAIYGAFGQNIQFPNITAYYDDIPGTTGSPTPNPIHIKPEYVNDYEAGVRYQAKGFSGSLAYYREDFTNTFVDSYNDTTESYTVSNGGDSRYQGVELQALEDFGQQDWGGDFQLYFNYAYNKAEFTSAFTTDYSGDGLSVADVKVKKGTPVADVPNQLVSGGGTATLNGWRFDTQARFVGKQYTDQATSGTPSGTTLNSYVVVDLGLSKTIPLSYGGFGKSIKFQMNVNNLFNHYYYNYGETETNYSKASVLYASPGAPRSFSGRIEIAF